MSTCGYLKYISLLILVNVGQIPRTESAPVLVTNRRVPVEGVSFSFTCTLDAAISGTARFRKGDTSILGGCSSSGSCGSSVSGYSVSLDSTSRILTLDIASPDSTRDSGTWRCNDGTNTVSNRITLSHVAAVLDWRSVTFSPQLTSLPSSVTPQNTISVTVTTPCAAPAAVITWRYQQGVSGVPPSSTSSSQGSCPSGQVQTTNTLSLPGNTASLYNRQVSLTVSVEHDSFVPPTYTKSVTSNTIQFPVFQWRARRIPGGKTGSVVDVQGAHLAHKTDSSMTASRALYRNNCYKQQGSTSALLKYGLLSTTHNRQISCRQRYINAQWSNGMFSHEWFEQPYPITGEHLTSLAQAAVSHHLLKRHLEVD